MTAEGQAGAFAYEEFHSADPHSVDWLYSNARGLRQAAGELSQLIAEKRPPFFAICETHLNGDPIKPLIPSGYKEVARLDRSLHGGGLLIGAKSHLLVNTLDMSKYNVKEKAELVGVRFEGVDYVLCYTPHSVLAPNLLNAMQCYMLDNPTNHKVFMGDFNVHNSGWIVSSSPTDKGGIEAQEFCEMF